MTMFHTLESATFEQVNENKKKSATPHFSQVKFTRFCGARARSVSGCLTCRKRKKKCDEVHPKCGNCKHRGEVCEWPVKGERKSTKLRRISGSESSQMHENTNLFAKINQNSKNADVGFATPPSPQKSALALPSTTSMSVSSREKMKIDFLDNAPDDMRANEVVQELEGFKEDLANFQLALEQSRSSTAGNGSVELYDEDGTEDVYIPTEFLAGFGFPYFSNLDKDGMVFLECYREQYSTFVSIGTETSNYFLKTFLSIAASNEGITYALTAWGGFFLELRKPRSDFTKPWEYMQKATRCMCSQMGDYLRPNDKNQFYELFAFYLIFIGIEVCTGDVRNWRGFMTQCSLLIQSYGGILKVLDLFGYSNDIKWLVSDFKFHDLLSSKCLIDGPIFLVEDYMKALEPRPEYGIDPLQGIVGPLYDIIGRIGTAKADLARKWAQVKYNVQAQDSDAEQITASYYDMAQQMIDNLKAQIASCTPSVVHMDLLADDEEDRKLHLALFELHVHICRLQLATSLERMPPNAITQQCSLHKALPLIDYLQATKLKVSLSLSLLVCGMTCCAPHDRASMTRRFRLHSNQYEIGNLQRIEETVVGAWECNPTGAVCIDWAEFVRDKEWHLYVG